MGLLPSNYEVPESGGSGLYIKLQPGENRFRILAQPTTGYVVWEDRQPTRYKDRSDVPTGAEDVKHFWFVPVWWYDKDKNGSVKFLEMSQKTVIQDLAALDAEEDWGNLNTYDVKVKREGEKMDTKYTTQPVPHKPTPKEALEEWDKMKDGYKPENLFVENGVTYIPAESSDKEELPF